ncbi:MAG TPA: class I SAM-dependent methyltransferase [Chlamydiales bacterium]|nr:class I SAM-dependent methyltransferase [Chlamydiales bacterium]
MHQSRSFENVNHWYNKLVGDEGHYYHKNVILPNIENMLQFAKIKKASILDIGCGQGILSKTIPSDWQYVGLDLSGSLIKEAKKSNRKKNHQFIEHDATLPIDLKNEFDFVTFILSLQDIDDGNAAITHAASHLKSKGKMILVLNHPFFRIPRQTSWHIDQKNRKMTREVSAYLSPMKIPIQTAPSKNDRSKTVFSHHTPLSVYSKWFQKSGLLIESIDEWISDKKSTSGPFAKIENRLRKEIPLFMTITLVKL